MNVLVIPEDFRKDQYVLKPIIKALLTDKGQPRARVAVCQDPLLGGIDQALNWERISKIIDQYRGMINLFLLIVDRDGEAGRRQSLDELENKARGVLPEGRRLLAENAWQEVEVWVLAGHDDLPTDWAWKDIRANNNPKEAYYLPFAQLKRCLEEPGQGRKKLAEEAASRLDRMLQLCPEDLAALQARI